MSNGNNNLVLHGINRGFSLVELMVALLITLILLAGIGQIFLSSKKSFVIQDSLARMQENGRYALETVAQDIRRAGYWGGNADISTIEDHAGGTGKVATDDGTCADSSWALMLTHRIFGKEDGFPNYDPSYRTGYTCLPPDTNPKGDILVLRYAAPWEVGDMTTPCYVKNQYYLRSSLFEGRLFKCSDGKNSACSSGGTCPEEAGYPIDAPAVRTAELVSHGYFIHAVNTSDKCPAAGKVPSLYRQSLVNGVVDQTTPEEIAYGVDNFQVQYGLDTDGDDSVDSFVDAPAAGDAKWGQVSAARIWLLVRAECPETGYTNDTTYTMAGKNYTPNDPYRRQLFTSTVQLRNR